MDKIALSIITGCVGSAGGSDGGTSGHGGGAVGGGCRCRGQW
jgi:hypothetical protein